ncbi:hypothetical protein CBR_g18624 [Chara braunii]|uniref:Uncharacterized protein n=1 Tax=Chara braunii TaxID=69332 RepID=A0A388JT79_CHABU|nr:hypothetical protein CBR_g18624 [Chara braunii]|eukprot:GBG61029.1 hypothetical protein CBR_g18624 [Chara braunii]
MASHTRDDAPSFWEKWTGWRLRGRAVDDGLAAGRWETLRRHDGGSEGDRCTISVVHNHNCKIELSAEGGAPVRKCERTKQVLRHCLGQPPEVIESSSDVKVTKNLDGRAADPDPDPAPAPILPSGPGWNERGLRLGHRAGRPLDAEWFRLFGHHNSNTLRDESAVAELPSSKFSPFHVWWFGVPDEDRESMREPFGEPRAGDGGASSAMEEAFPRTEEMLRQSGIWPGKGEEEHVFGLGRRPRRGGCPHGSEGTQDGSEKSGGEKDGKRFAEFQKDFYEV